MVLSQCKDWINQLNLKYVEDSENQLSLPWDIEGIQFLVRVFISERWIQLAALIMNSASVPSDKKESLYAALLQQNWALNDVTYSIDEKGNIYSENDISVESNFENFRSELGAVVFGVTNFFKQIAPDLGLKATDTYKT